ncbi:hypothetical protein LCGC14_0378050 [marine sediment metagenome]|uniref:SF3 helicase domain-containing protein n=1 Tax=marine sediment metagenome TaxID=412755 RepID=A0A0F9TL99_9ZZZZ
MKQENIKRFEMFISKLQGVQKQNEYRCMSLCPSHGDANNSLWTTLNENGKIGVACHGGCKVIEIVSAMGFQGLGVLYGAPQIVAVYDFITAEGEFLYQEVKYDKDSSLSRFAVRRLNPKYSKTIKNVDGEGVSTNAHVDSKGKKIDKWIYGLPKDNAGGAGGAGQRILFNLHEVIVSKKSENDEGEERGDCNIVFMNEGAKDAETLRKLGLTSTAALINDWEKTDTSPLDGRNVVILVDYDEDSTNGMNAGEIKALKAAHNRYGKSSSVKLLRLPGLKEIGNHSDVTDWLNAGINGTVPGNARDKLLELALSDDLKEWQPCESIRERIENGKMTGLIFEKGFPGPIWETWYGVYHSLTNGLLLSYDKDWLKGCIKSLLYNETEPDTQLKTIQRMLKYCGDAKSKDSNAVFKGTPRDFEEILRACQIEVGIDAHKYATMPIFRSSFMPDHEREWRSSDIVIMKSSNFYIPSKRAYPRNMQSCIARHALPFDYDADAKCPMIEESLRTQWSDDQESIDLFLQYIFYCMISAPGKYKSILSMIGAPNTGKSKYLQLIVAFIGNKSCEAISLSKLGLQFELFRTIFSKVLICDDENVTKKENLLSIPAGQPIRVERKGGDIETRIIPAQIIIAGNKPIRMHSNSSGLSERLKFLVFRHVYKRGDDMDENIMDTWRHELPGLMNLVLGAGEKLVAARGFVEPKSSIDAREQFESGANPVLRFIREYFEQNDIDCLGNLGSSEVCVVAPWVVTLENMKVYYGLYCEEFEVRNKLTVHQFNEAMESVPGISRKRINVKKTDAKTNQKEWKQVRCWIGLRRNGTDGTLDDRRASNGVGNDF